jgi:hypothetical protein
MFTGVVTYVTDFFAGVGGGGQFLRRRKTMTDALVLAAPERKRILRELLAIPEPWTAAQRDIYCQMIEGEYWPLMKSRVDDFGARHLEREVFGYLIAEGWTLEQAREMAAQAPAAQEAQKTKGQRERGRRRTFREAVTAKDGALAVTTGLVKTCIICGGPFYRGIRRRHRVDSAYCSNACRQSAYRSRHVGQTERQLKGEK